uniref:Eukaryotic translation initiation factor 2D n=1 Tax=Triatoma dimidiata TaxID=72491 RepID=A0A0V0GAF2_TRIDM
MFRKEFKVKSNCQLKTSDKKKLYATILNDFSQLTDADLQTVLPLKESINQAKITTAQGDIINVYICRGLPLILYISERVIPTVYFLWNFPNLLHGFEVTNFVVEKLAQGADLMVPGILKSDGDNPYGQVKLNEIVCIRRQNNKAAVAVGLSLISSPDMTRSDGRGRGVEILHIYGDYLYKMATEKIQMPIISVENVEIVPVVDVVEEAIADMEIENHSENLEKPEPNLSPDEIVMNLFLLTLKKSNNKINLPILTNLFYKNYMLNNLPTSVEFDIKKTKYKKLSTFLNEMEKDNLIKLQNINNVQSIIEINIENEQIMHFRNKFKENAEGPSCTTDEGKLAIEKVVISETYVVNSNVLLFFTKFGHKKNDCLTAQEVRKLTCEYVKAENLQDPTNKGLVVLDPVLSKVTQAKPGKLDWKTLVEKILSLMGNCYEVRKNDSIISSGKGRIPNIEIVTRIRSGNKKVTIVDNLEIYGVDLQEISRECQHGLATSTTLNRVASRKGMQFQVQGCHSGYIRKLLTEKYCIPVKYISE